MCSSGAKARNPAMSWGVAIRSYIMTIIYIVLHITTCACRGHLFLYIAYNYTQSGTCSETPCYYLHKCLLVTPTNRPPPTLPAPRSSACHYVFSILGPEEYSINGGVSGSPLPTLAVPFQTLRRPRLARVQEVIRLIRNNLTL